MHQEELQSPEYVSQSTAPRARASTFSGHHRSVPTDRIPAYYDAPSIGPPIVGTRGPRVTINKLLGLETPPPSPKITSRESVEKLDVRQLLGPRISVTSQDGSLVLPPSPEAEQQYRSSALIHISPSWSESTTGATAEKPRTASLDIFRWPRHPKHKMRRDPGGLYRIVQTPRFKEAYVICGR